MSGKQDSDDVTGQDTVPDTPDVDLEDRPTELWAPAGRRVFDESKSDADTAAQAAAAGDTDPEDRDTEIMDDPSPAGLGAAAAGVPDGEEAARIAEAEQEAARLLSDTVEVEGAEARASRALVEEEQAARTEGHGTTLVVERPRLPKLSHECRMCGRKIARPVPRRLRGPRGGPYGFRCEQCGNVFCAAHVVRVTGLVRSLLYRARFRCNLCLPEAQPPARH